MMFAIDTAPAYRVQVDASAAPEVVEMAACCSDQRVPRPCGPTRTTAAPPATSDWPVPSERIGPWWRARKCSTGGGAGPPAILVRRAPGQPPPRRWPPPAHPPPPRPPPPRSPPPPPPLTPPP